MADIKYLSLSGLETYDELIKKYADKAAKNAADGKDAAIEAAKNAADAAQGDVDSLEELVGTIPASATATTVVGYAKEVADAASGDASKVATELASYKTTNDAAVAANKTAIETEATTARAAEEALGGRIDGVEDLIGTIPEGSTVANEISKAETAAKSYTDTEIGKLGSVLNFKGTVATVSALPTEGNKVGDVYHVTEKSAEYVYVADNTWEELGSVIDLSAYETIQGAEGKISVAKNEAIQAAKDYADGLDSAMDARVDALEAAIGEGGSVADKIKNAIDALDVTVTNGATGEGAIQPDVVISITEEDGLLKAVSASVTAERFDAYGAASNVQGETTETVASVNAKVNAIKSIEDSEIEALFE